MCSENVLKNRLQRDIDKKIRSADIIERSVSRIKLYEDMDSTVKIDTDSMTAEQTADEIITTVEGKCLENT